MTRKNPTPEQMAENEALFESLTLLDYLNKDGQRRSSGYAYRPGKDAFEFYDVSGTECELVGSIDSDGMIRDFSGEYLAHILSWEESLVRMQSKY